MKERVAVLHPPERRERVAVQGGPTQTHTCMHTYLAASDRLLKMTKAVPEQSDGAGTSALSSALARTRRSSSRSARRCSDRAARSRSGGGSSACLEEEEEEEEEGGGRSSWSLVWSLRRDLSRSLPEVWSCLVPRARPLPLAEV